MGMLAATLALAAQPVAEPQAAEPPVENEIEVIARRLREFQFTFSVREGKIVCTPVTSLGDKAMDAFACDGMAQCVATAFEPQVAKLRKTKLRKKKRAAKAKELLDQTLQDPSTKECFDETVGPKVKDFLDAEWRARQ